MKNISVIIFIILLFSTSANAQDNASDVYKKAKQYDSLNNTVKAIEYYTKTIDIDPAFLNAYFNRGAIFAQQKKYTQALDDFRKFDNINPNDHEVQYLMAACYYYLGDKNTSFELVNKALGSKQDFFDALKLRGEIYNENNNYKMAVADIEMALTINNEPELYSMMGVAYEGLKDNNAALKNYLIAEQLGYNHQLLFNNLGHLISLDKSKLNSAIIYFNKALAIDPNFAICYFNKGNALYDLGFKESAVDCWKKAQNLGFNNFNEETKKRIH